MKEKQNSICLRPHHGMCLAYFEGRGYSREFAEHMGKILDIMERDARVSLTAVSYTHLMPDQAEYSRNMKKI